MEHTADLRELRNSIQVDAAAPQNVRDGRWFSYGGAADGFTHLDPILSRQSMILQATPPPDRKSTDLLFYIYTRYEFTFTLRTLLVLWVLS